MPKLNVSDFTKSGVIVLLGTLSVRCVVDGTSRAPLSRALGLHATLKTVADVLYRSAQRLLRISAQQPVPSLLRAGCPRALTVFHTHLRAACFTPLIYGVCVSCLTFRGSVTFPKARRSRRRSAGRCRCQPSGATGPSLLPATPRASLQTPHKWPF